MPGTFEVFAPRPASIESPLRVLLPDEGTSRFDPFLVVHQQGPVVYPPRRAIGFPDHPHRGVEIITYVVAGEQYHRDSFGNDGVLCAGDVQMMSAARGIIHSELPSERLYDRGGLVHAYQVWLNLPHARKMDEPHYQDARASALPRIVVEGTSTTVLAGELEGRCSPLDCKRPFLMCHVVYQPLTSRSIALPANSTAVLAAIEGSAHVDGAGVSATEVAIGSACDRLAIRAGNDGFEALLLAAPPLGEPVVSRGPFVMTSEAEIEEAYRDLIEGRFGSPTRRH